MESLQNFTEINKDLVEAQECRRILDRLVGYTLSPILWKKVAYGLSAGRVQSVALRLVAEKELQRLAFQKNEYKSFTLNFEKPSSFEAKVTVVSGKPLVGSKDFDSITGALKAAAALHVTSDKEASQLQGRLKKRGLEGGRH